MPKARVSCKRMKKRGGGFQFRKVKVLASGKWQFVKGKCNKGISKLKGKTRKRKTKKRKR